jgi:nitrate reductase (cytochrome), electron transfer subunit
MRGQDRPGDLIMHRAILPLFALLYGSGVALAQAPAPAELVGPPAPMDTIAQEPVPKWVTDDVRRMRAYPEQPPTIPHSIDGYQLSVNTNRCMSCHKREYTQGSGAPMISVTHFQTRDGQMLADISPRRYFCTECHVPQANVGPLVENRFRDMSELGFKPAGSE